MKLYEERFQILDNGKTRVMIAKAIRSYHSNSDKLAVVHISPVTVEQCDGYAMETNYSEDRCIRLPFRKPYGKNQSKAMIQEIKKLAEERLQMPFIDESLESVAFKKALEHLSNM